MFGLNDNSSTDSSTSNTTGDTTLPPLRTSINGDGSSSDMPPSINSAPPAPVSESPTPTTEPPAPVPPPDLTTPSTSTSATSDLPKPSGIGELNLDNAYITGDKPSQDKSSTSISMPEPSPQPTAASLLNNTSNSNSDLLKLKQQALQSLAPLVDHLDQDAEEKFKTTMMLIQASDNADLIPEAYEAAGKITDEKVRAQALLDVVNEINYFTQQHNQ